MHISPTDLVLPTDALLIAALLVFLQNHFFSAPYIKDRCRVQLAFASLVALIFLTVTLVQAAVEMIAGIIDPPVVVIIVILVIIAILLILILQHGLPAWKRAKMLPLLYSLKKVLTKYKAVGAGGLSPDEQKELQEDVDEMFKKIGDAKIDPKSFSPEEQEQIKELIKTLEEQTKSPTMPDDLKRMIEKLIEVLKPLG